MTDATTRQALRALLATLDDLPLDDLPAELAALRKADAALAAMLDGLGGLPAELEAWLAEDAVRTAGFLSELEAESAASLAALLADLAAGPPGNDAISGP